MANTIMTGKRYLERDHGVYEIRGAAGAGKTFNLIQDIKILHERKKRVIVISFSNAAVDELDSRLYGINVDTSTIHSFCWQILRPLINRIFETLSWDHGYTPEAFEGELIETEKIKIIRYGEIGIPSYDMKTGELWLSHDDVIKIFIRAVSEISSFSEIIVNAFDYILIDEYQDTNGKFLETLFKYISVSCVIGLYGDPFQSIYLNADSLNVASLEVNQTKSGFKVETFYLDKNYRSQKNLVRIFNEYRSGYDHLEQSAEKPANSKISVFIGSKSLDSATADCIANSMDFDEFVLLSLTNMLRTLPYGVSKLAKKLRDSVSKRLNWNEVLDVEHLHPRIRVLWNFGKLFFGNNIESITALLSLFDSDSIQSQSFNEIRNTIDSQKKSSIFSVEELERQGLFLKKELRPITAWLSNFNFEFLNQVTEFYKNISVINEHSMTIFAAKGLEFQNVVLNIDDGFFPGRNWDTLNFHHSETDKLNINSDIMSYLFYVGLTRAKEGLAIYVNQRRHRIFLNNLKEYFPHLNYVEL